MSRAKRIQTEPYTTFRSRLHRKLLPECKSCHQPVHSYEVVCPWCGANRKQPSTGVTQRLPTLPAPVPWQRHYTPLTLGLLFTLVQTSIWLWLWPVSRMVAGDTLIEERFYLFFRAVVMALCATICLHFRWKLRLIAVLIILLLCWIFRIAMT